MKHRSEHEAPLARPLRERVKEATREAILAAAEAVFSERGFAGARMEDIAERAGVAVGTLYNYFDDRRALLDAVLLSVLEGLSSQLASPGAAGEGPLEARLARFVEVALSQIDAHFRLFAILIEEELERGRGRGQAGARPMLLEVYEAAERFLAASKGELRRGDAALYPSLLVGMLRGLFMRKLRTGDSAPLASQGPALVRLFLDGARRPA